MKYEAIEQYSSEFSVKKMCEVLELDPSNYYRWKKNENKRREKLRKELWLVHKIEKIFQESDRTYGYRVIRQALQKEEIEISEYKVRKIMKENGMYPEICKRYQPVRNGRTDGRYLDNLLGQDFTPEKQD